MADHPPRRPAPTRQAPTRQAPEGLTAERRAALEIAVIDALIGAGPNGTVPRAELRATLPYLGTRPSPARAGKSRGSLAGQYLRGVLHLLELAGLVTRDGTAVRVDDLAGLVTRRGQLAAGSRAPVADRGGAVRYGDRAGE